MTRIEWKALTDDERRQWAIDMEPDEGNPEKRCHEQGVVGTTMSAWIDSNDNSPRSKPGSPVDKPEGAA